MTEVIASTKEEKSLLDEKKELQEKIKELMKKNEELETEAERFDRLTTTIEYEPFVELKTMVSRAIQDKAKNFEFKACDKPLKNGKSIEDLIAMLQEYQDLAEQNRTNIELNNEDISKIEDKIAEIDSKLNQTKLPLK